MSYLAWKLLHILSVVLFLGNITTGLFWAAHAHKTRDGRLIALTFDGIRRSDRFFTVPGVVGIIVSGLAAAMNAHYPILHTGWILWPILLFSFSGIVFGVWVAPLQTRIARLAQGMDPSGPAWEDYGRMYKAWEIWGFVALITPALAAAIMVLKPALPSL
jgi:uncharacterized membrane protein